MSGLLSTVVSDDVYIDKLREIIGSDLGGRSNDPANLLSHVCLGSQRNAESLRLLRKLGVTHVLNCAGFKGERVYPERNPYEGLNIDYKEFKADDDDRYDITQHFREAFNYLDKVEKLGGVCFVHCALGINRSAAICVAYLMTHSKMTILRAVKFIKSRRRVILSNAGFRRQLVRWARLKGHLDPLSDDEYEDSLKRYTRRISYGTYGDNRPSRSTQRLDYTPSRSTQHLNYPAASRSSSLGSFTSNRSRDSVVRSADYERGDAKLDYLYNKFINRQRY